MPNKSHFNSALRTMNRLGREALKHSSSMAWKMPETTYHAVFVRDALEVIRSLPDHSIQLIICDPPYNLELAEWDTFPNYLEWAKLWLNEVPRILSESDAKFSKVVVVTDVRHLGRQIVVDGIRLARDQSHHLRRYS